MNQSLLLAVSVALLLAVASTASCADEGSRPSGIELDMQIFPELTRFSLFNECRPVGVGLVMGTGIQPGIGANIRDMMQGRLRAAKLLSKDVVGDAAYLDFTASSSEANLSYHRNLNDTINGSSGMAATWESHRTTNGNSDHIKLSASELIDEFILEYLHVNEDACSQE